MKENVVIEGKFVVDKDDNSITRTDSQYKTLFARAGLSLVLEMIQPHWPDVRCGVNCFSECSTD